MSKDRTEGRRANHRALRPTLDGALEARCVLSHAAPIKGAVFLANPKLGLAFKSNNPPHRPRPTARRTGRSNPHPGTKATQTGHGGQ